LQNFELEKEQLLQDQKQLQKENKKLKEKAESAQKQFTALNQEMTINRVETDLLKKRIYDLEISNSDANNRTKVALEELEKASSERLSADADKQQRLIQQFAQLQKEVQDSKSNLELNQFHSKYEREKKCLGI